MNVAGGATDAEQFCIFAVSFLVPESGASFQCQPYVRGYFWVRQADLILGTSSVPSGGQD